MDRKMFIVVGEEFGFWALRNFLKDRSASFRMTIR